MTKRAIYVELKARSGKAEEVAAFLKSAKSLVEQEPGTVAWFAIRYDQSTFAIFDAFDDEAGRQAHLNGKVAAALMARAEELLAEAPQLRTPEVLADKLPG
ncbi:antibiotic biosynthesis monooxygenase [Rhizobium sp. R72]|uniref:putative quinol monooxygenase n=1 Tax=unclassified Rhizobium TaxID=2613769 RepID=UPI000B52DB5E|nr:MULTISPECIES: antibiotic biosynthesis monooxygenase [unclassified Rhizobium]OWV98500.1 antibiotic biosynthesis monooxygenase [Rhizobium sp. R693]OWW03736.1 antibiotic biosynthesis monooxygenase [Rhizobium sp. R72]OWW03943.1 antibiotic biosynthesis monooxygenase [Rhizobium sp. R711]